MEWYLLVLQKYAEFNGRSRRKEYWTYTLITMIFFIVLYSVGLFMIMQGNKLGIAVMGVYGLYALATFVPSLAVCIRRLHDTNRSGWWILISLLPLVGGIILIVLLAIEGDPANNLYGPSPKLLAQPAAMG
jgi:uncharacterized membrane protein YhaH (DUF805 family)